MAETYKWITLNQLVKRGSDGSSIPNEPGNIDWQKFQADGGVATAADPPPSAAELLAGIHAQANAWSVTGADPMATLLRAASLVIMDRFNVMIQRDLDRAADTAAASSLANLQTRWATRAPLALLNAGQIQGAIQAKINANAAD